MALLTASQNTLGSAWTTPSPLKGFAAMSTATWLTILVAEDGMLVKLLAAMDHVCHPLHKPLDKLKSSFSNNFTQPRCLKEQQRK